MFHWYDIVGFFGITMIVGAYFLLQIERLRSDGFIYSLLNGFGALCVIFSLLFAFNLSAFLVEAFWVVISFIGVIRYFTRRRRTRELAHDDHDDP